MNPDLLVRIRTPRLGGKTRTGTGYVIAPNLVLTARHVLLPDDRDQALPVRLEWTQLACRAEQVTRVPGNWEQYDIAIVQCEFPDKVKSCCQVLPICARQAATSGAQWESAGYPKLHSFELKDAIGTFGADLAQHTLNLTVIDTIERANVPADVREHPWGGMSGAPVFSVQGKLLHAVILHHHGWMQKEVGAVSIPWLLQHSVDFKRLIEDESLNSHKTQLNKIISRELTLLLNNQNIPLVALTKELQLAKTAGARDVAEYLVEQLAVSDSFAKLTRLCQQQNRILASNTDRWMLLLDDIEQLCGWLLLKTVKLEWWLAHEAAFVQQTATHLNYCFSDVSQPYVEVIISRQFLQAASYKLDDYGYAVPRDRNEDACLLFDAITPDASDIELLTPIFQDLRRPKAIPTDVNALVTGIKREVHVKLKARNGKPIYYLVSETYFNLIKGRLWFRELESSLAGQLHFISCLNDTVDETRNPCTENQEAILDQLAAILRFRDV